MLLTYRVALQSVGNKSGLTNVFDQLCLYLLTTRSARELSVKVEKSWRWMRHPGVASIAARESTWLPWRREFHPVRRHIQNVGDEMVENSRSPEW